MLTLTQAIETRRSTRTFTGPAPDEALLRLCGAGAGTHVLPLPAGTLRHGKVGTYGIIKGSPAYVAVVHRADDTADTLRAGIEGERFVLECTRLGLGTCWLGGTFNRTDVRRALPGLPDGHTVAAVIAVGTPASSPRLLDRLMRKVARSDNRRPLADIIIAGEAPAALTKALEALRLAPSAANRQPWRLAFNRDGSIDVYGDPRDSFMTLDTGIALAHFLALAPAFTLLPPRSTHPTLTPLAHLSKDS